MQGAVFHHRLGGSTYVDTTAKGGALASRKGAAVDFKRMDVQDASTSAGLSAVVADFTIGYGQYALVIHTSAAQARAVAMNIALSDGGCVAGSIVPAQARLASDSPGRDSSATVTVSSMEFDAACYTMVYIARVSASSVYKATIHSPLSIPELSNTKSR
jgi:hypothetical protein